jgi:transposase
MLSLRQVQRVCLVNRKVDFRKGHDGLLGESYGIGLKPYDGDLVIFVGRHRNSIKLLLFDGSGLWVLYKKFKEGSLRKQFRFISEPSVTTVTFAEVSLLLEGAQYTIY